MIRDRIRFFVAIFAGIILGGVAGSQIGSTLGITLGMLIGGVAAWILVDPAQAWQGVRLAVKHAAAQKLPYFSVDWKNVWQKVVFIMLGGVAGISLLSVVLLFTAVPYLCGVYVHSEGGEQIRASIQRLVFHAPVLLISSFTMSAFVYFALVVDEIKHSSSSIQDHIIAIRTVIVKYNALAVSIWLIFHVILSVIALILHTPTAYRFLVRAAQLGFLYVNSKQRIAALVFAAIGSLAAILTEQILLSALLGACIGMAQHMLTQNLRTRLAERLAST